MQGILLAAGFGRRFQTDKESPQDKLLCELSDHHSVLWHSATSLINAIPMSVAVIQPQQAERKKLLLSLGFEVLESERARNGMGYALADAVQHSKSEQGWLIALADMPWVSTELIQKIVKQVNKAQHVVAPRFNGKRGQPIAFGSDWRRDLSKLEGDTGAKNLLKSAEIDWLDWHDESIHRDVDSINDIT